MTKARANLWRQYGRTPPAPVVGGGTPTWLSTAVIGEWKELPNTKPSAFTDTWGSSAHGVLDDYSGFGVTPGGLVVIHGGGHAGYTGNEVLGFDLTQNAPALYTVLAPTPAGSRTPADGTMTWFGTLPNQKKNIGHTYDSMAYSPSLGKMLYFNLISIYGGAGGTLSNHTFSVDPTANGTGWVQTSDSAYLGAGQGGSATVATDGADNFWVCPGYSVYKFNPSSGWTTVTTNAVLNWNNFGALVYDSTRNKLLRGSDYGDQKFMTIDPGTGAVTDVRALMTGSVGDLAELQNQSLSGPFDGFSMCYDPINDRYLVKGTTGGVMYAINAGTWAVTKLTPATSAGSTAVPSQSGVLPGHLRYCAAVQSLIYVPNGTSNFYAMRLA